MNTVELKKIAVQLAIDVDNYCDRKWGDEERSHLGASLIGDECQRKLWYGFRWCGGDKPEPRVKRLFDRGHKEEDRFIDYLTGIGCKVQPFDPSYRLLYQPDENEFEVLNNATIIDVKCKSNGYIDVSDKPEYVKKANDLDIDYPVQWRVSGVQGHFGGSLDGKGYLPEHYPIKEEILFEFKTHNKASFAKLKKEGMKLSKPQHYAQCCVYGYKMKLNYVCYVAVNKDDDDLHFEIVELNHNTGAMLEIKAEKIIVSQEPPPRLNENPNMFLCKMCSYRHICHADGKPEQNCRSCKHAKPANDKKWICTKFNQELTKEIIVGKYQCWECIA